MLSAAAEAEEAARGGELMDILQTFFEGVGAEKSNPPRSSTLQWPIQHLALLGKDRHRVFSVPTSPMAAKNTS